MLRPEGEAAWPISAGAEGMWGSDGKSAKGVEQRQSMCSLTIRVLSSSSIIMNVSSPRHKFILFSLLK